MESLLTEAPRTIEYIKDLPKFKNISDDVFNKMKSLGFDSLNNGGYSEWVLNRYLTSDENTKKRFVEDLYKVMDALKIFNEKKNKGFFKDPKDINQYKSLQDIFIVSDKYKDEKSKGDFKVKSSQVTNDEIDKVFENDKWTVYIPKTKEASCVLGRGTQWCTASQGENNMYDHYTKDGPLYIIISKDDPKIKYQYHEHSNQFMDIYDNSIDKKIIMPMMFDDGLALYFYDKYTYDYSSLLYIAITNNMTDYVEKIVKLGSKISIDDINAAILGDLDIKYIKLLLKHKKKLNISLDSPAFIRVARYSIENNDLELFSDCLRLTNKHVIKILYDDVLKNGDTELFNIYLTYLLEYYTNKIDILYNKHLDVEKKQMIVLSDKYTIDESELAFAIVNKFDNESLIKLIDKIIEKNIVQRDGTIEYMRSNRVEKSIIDYAIKSKLVG